MMAVVVDVPVWIKWWLSISAFLMTWDAGFVLLRPWTRTGSLAAFWAPYKLYSTVDLMYGEERWLRGDRFCEAQSVCNLVEVALQCLAVYLLNKKQKSAAAMVIIVTQTMTFWKTMLYWLYDILGGLESTGHNTLATWIFIYGIPNGFWIVVPFFVLVNMASQVLRVLQAQETRIAGAKDE